jgi:hypothetical protein
MPVCARGWRQSAEPALGRGLAWPAIVGRWPSVLAMWCYCHHGSYALVATATRHATLRATLTLLRYLCHSATMPLLLVPRRAVARLLTMCTWVRPLPCCPHRRFAIFGTMATWAVLGWSRVCVVCSACAHVALVTSSASREDDVASSSNFPPFPLFSLPSWPTEPRH